MKKKGQGTSVVIVLLVIIAIVLIVIGMRLFNSSISGNVVKEDINPSIIETCSLSQPFICEDSSIATSNGVKLSIMNGGNEDIFLQKIILTNCLETAKDLTYNLETEGTLINKRSDEVITLICDKKLENVFRGNIEITYEVVGSSTKSKATGSITRNVL